jgi:hypothetical protein
LDGTYRISDGSDDKVSQSCGATDEGNGVTSISNRAFRISDGSNDKASQSCGASKEGNGVTSSKDSCSIGSSPSIATWLVIAKLLLVQETRKRGNLATIITMSKYVTQDVSCSVTTKKLGRREQSTYIKALQLYYPQAFTRHGEKED